MRPHLHHSHELAARFHDPTAVEAVLTDLGALDAADPDHRHHLRVEVHRGHGLDLAEAERRLRRELAIGTAVMVPFCAVATAVLLWGIAVLGDLDDRMALVLSGLPAGALLGLLFGGLLGILLTDGTRRRAERFEDATEGPDDILVLAEFEDPRPSIAVDDFEQVVGRIFASHHGEPVAV